MNRHEMTRNFGTLASLALLLVGVVGCSVDSPTAPDQVPAPPPTVGGNNWTISVTVTPDELVAGSNVPATIEVDVESRDDGSNPPNGTTMTVSTSLGELGASGSGAQIGEMLEGLRWKPTPAEREYVLSAGRKIPVLARYDVLVVGGGTGGAPAGIAAARAGAKTLVIERLHGLGGVGTLGRISNYYHGNRVGFTSEVDAGVGTGSRWNIE